MDKLLKQVYKLHRNEIRDLKLKLDALEKAVGQRTVNGCEKCSQLLEAIQRKTDDEILLFLKEFCEENWQIRKWIKPVENNELSQSGMKTTSIFDDTTLASDLLHTTEEQFSPVEETPVEFMDKLNLKENFRTLNRSSTFLPETVDEINLTVATKPPNTTAIKNQCETNKKLKPSIVTVGTIDCYDDSSDSDKPLLSPVLSQQTGNAKTATEDMCTDNLNLSLDDFEVPRLFKRRREESPKKEVKVKNIVNRNKGWKPSVPSTSKAKYMFVPAGPGYRKPKYRQITLSQTFSDLEKNKAKEKEKISITDSTNKSTSADNRATPEDLDCTYVPSQLLKNAGKCDKTVSDTTSTKNKDQLKTIDTVVHCIESDDTISSDSEDLLTVLTTKRTRAQDKWKPNVKTSPTTSTKLPDNFFNDYNVLPNRSPEVNFKYARDAVRKKDERMRLDGQKCYQCEKYYDDLGLSESQKKERLNNCSKHRDKFAQPRTPEHFWSPDFPSTQESKRRAILRETRPVPLQKRRLRLNK